MKNNYDDIIQGFDLYLDKIEAVGKNAHVNYMSWIRFLAKQYNISDINTPDDIKKILEEEEVRRQLPSRDRYKKRKDIGNFRSTLNRFLPFLKTWRVEQILKNDTISYTQLIEKIRTQDSPEMAKYLHNAIIMIATTTKHVFSAEEQIRMRDNMIYASSGNATVVVNGPASFSSTGEMHIDKVIKNYGTIQQ